MTKTLKEIRNGGRPKMKEEDRKEKIVSFRVDELTQIAIKEKVKEAKMSMSEFLRRAVKNAEISPAEYEGYFREIDTFNSARLVDFISVPVTVEQPWSKEEIKSLNALYRFARDVNTLVKRGNASLAGEPESVRLNYRKELDNLQHEFNVIKDYFLKRITGEIRKAEL